MVGVPDRRMAGTQTQQPDEARHIWRAQDGRGPAYKRQRDRRGAEEGQAMSVRGRGLDFVPKAVGRRRRVWTRAGQQCPGLQHDPIRPGLPAHQALPLSRAVFWCCFIHSFIHTAHWPSAYRVANIMHTRSLTLRSSPSEDGATQREAYDMLQCDADRL